MVDKKENNQDKKKVFVAMSGGVDSSVSAALLKEQGYLVAGVFMRFWSQDKNKNKKTKITRAESRARKVARVLKIPFFVFNFEKEFKRKVVSYFLKENKQGKTPNPCVFCNKEIKFGLFLKKSLQLKADFVATGHYVRKIDNKKNKLFKGKDKEKDQSYFLWQLSQDQLEKSLFPIGNYTKKQVREMAKKFKLSFVSKSRESQEVCFIKTTTNRFLKKYLKQRKGDIVDDQGNILGEHKGLWFYTIGQRKGIKLPKGPYYVFEKDLKNNKLIVVKNKKDISQKELIAEKVNWISGRKHKQPIRVKAKIRYGHDAELSTISRIENKKYKVLFDKPRKAITSGQSVVFYSKRTDELLGGGVIK